MSERYSRKEEAGLPGLLEGKEEVWIAPWKREGIDPRPGLDLESAYTQLFGPERRWKVFATIFLECALETLPCSFHSSRDSESSQG